MEKLLPLELRKNYRQNQTDSLEEAFLKLTGNVIRDEEASATDKITRT